MIHAKKKNKIVNELFRNYTEPIIVSASSSASPQMANNEWGTKSAVPRIEHNGN